MEHSSFSIDEQPYASLFKIYDHEFLSISISKGLIDISNLSIAGDGMPVTTSARERKHRICKCSKSGITSCHCDCYFSQPDCDIGYDSSRECFSYIYWLQRTQKATCLYFLYSILHQSMILMGFWKLLPLEKMVSLSAKQDEK